MKSHVTSPSPIGHAQSPRTRYGPKIRLNPLQLHPRINSGRQLPFRQNPSSCSTSNKQNGIQVRTARSLRCDGEGRRAGGLRHRHGVRRPQQHRLQPGVHAEGLRRPERGVLVQPRRGLRALVGAREQQPREQRCPAGAARDRLRLCRAGLGQAPDRRAAFGDVRQSRLCRAGLGDVCRSPCPGARQNRVRRRARLRILRIRRRRRTRLRILRIRRRRARLRIRIRIRGRGRAALGEDGICRARCLQLRQPAPRQDLCRPGPAHRQDRRVHHLCRAGNPPDRQGRLLRPAPRQDLCRPDRRRPGFGENRDRRSGSRVRLSCRAALRQELRRPLLVRDGRARSPRRLHRLRHQLRLVKTTIPRTADLPRGSLADPPRAPRQYRISLWYTRNIFYVDVYIIFILYNILYIYTSLYTYSALSTKPSTGSLTRETFTHGTHVSYSAVPTFTD